MIGFGRFGSHRAGPIMRFKAIFILALSSLVATPFPADQPSAQLPQTTVECAVTSPNGIAAGRDQPDPGSYGNAQVSVGPFGLWRDGTLVFRPGGAGFISRDGSLGMKFGRRRGVSGQLKIEGRRVDAFAPPLRSEVPHGYGDQGFQLISVPSSL
jgi:hypothetical protein